MAVYRREGKNSLQCVDVCTYKHGLGNDGRRADGQQAGGKQARRCYETRRRDEEQEELGDVKSDIGPIKVQIIGHQSDNDTSQDL